MNVRTGGQGYRQMEGLMEGQMEGQLERRTEGKLNGRTDRQVEWVTSGKDWSGVVDVEWKGVRPCWSERFPLTNGYFT